jgi:hypothetical protein
MTGYQHSAFVLRSLSQLRKIGFSTFANLPKWTNCLFLAEGIEANAFSITKNQVKEWIQIMLIFATSRM